MGLAVDGANRHDMKLVRATVDSLPVQRPAPSPEHPQGLCLDKGYDFDEVRRTVDEFGFTAHIRSRGEEAQAIKKEAGFKARRWVVERTHSWMNRFRRVLVRWDKSPTNYIAFLHFACALIALRAAGSAVANFVAHEIGAYSSNNAHRILSGVLLGIAVGFAIHGLASHQFLMAALQMAWLAALECYVAIILHARGKLEPLMKRYEQAVRK